MPIVITLDDRITSIGSYCFTGNTSMFYETIHLPANLRRIEDYAFYNNYYLFDVQLVEGLTYIGDYAFFNCHQMVATTDEILSFYYTNNAHTRPYTGLLVIPDSVTYIGSYAFAQTAIYRVAFPHGLKHISAGTFDQVRDLNYVYLPDVLESIGDYAFRGCGTSYEFPNVGGYGQQVLRDYQLTVLPYAEVEDLLMAFGQAIIHLPASLRALGQYSFYNCSDVNSVVIPEGVTEIPAYCFAYCRHLSSVTLPESLVTIGERAFNKTYYEGVTVVGISEIYIPKGVTSIADFSLGFRNNYIRLPMKVTSYRDTEAERYTKWGQNVDLSGYSYSQGTWTFDPLDREALYLYGSMGGIGDETLTAYQFTETGTPDVFTLTTSLPEDSYVGLKRDKDDKDGAAILYYSAAEDPGENHSAVLTEGEAAAAHDHLLFVPGQRKVVFTLTRNGDGTFTLSYTLPTDYEIEGDFNGWKFEPLTYDPVAEKYVYSAELSADTYEFVLNLSGDDYGAKMGAHKVFDTVDGLRLYPEIGPDGNYDDTVYNLNLHASGGGAYTFIFDESACSLTVTSTAEPAAFLVLSDWNVRRMQDPAAADGEGIEYSEDMPMEESGGVTPPAAPYLFTGEDTAWAGMVLYESEEPQTFYIGFNGQTYGDDTVSFQEYYGGTAKSVKLIGSHTDRLVAGQVAEIRVWTDRSGVYDFYFGLESHSVMIKRRTVDYTIAYGLSKEFDGSRVSFCFETYITPPLDNADVIWYQIVDGARVEYQDGEVRWDWDDAAETNYTFFSGPCEVGEYLLLIRDQYGASAVSHNFSITEPGGAHTYALTGKLDKEYDGQPVAFDPYKDLLVDGGKSDWGMLEEKGEARYVWRMLDGKEYIDLKDTPREVGQYQLVIQELTEQGGKIDEAVVGEGAVAMAVWTDAAAFDFAITEGAHTHVYGAPKWSWRGTSSAMAVFTCDECQATETVNAALTYRVEDGALICVATAVFEGQTYNDSDFVTGDILILPAALTSIGSEAFSGVAAQIVVIPASVTHIDGSAFANCPNLYAVYGCNSAAESFASAKGLAYYQLTD